MAKHAEAGDRVSEADAVVSVMKERPGFTGSTKRRTDDANRRLLSGDAQV